MNRLALVPVFATAFALATEWTSAAQQSSNPASAARFTGTSTMRAPRTADGQPDFEGRRRLPSRGPHGDPDQCCWVRSHGKRPPTCGETDLRHRGPAGSSCAS